eukprot:4729473-Amphidinium_carterae.1
MPAPDMSGGSSRRVRSQSLGVSWHDQQVMEASEDVSMPQQAQAQAWHTVPESEGRSPLEFRYLGTPMPKIPLAENSSWAHTQTEWPVMAK